MQNHAIFIPTEAGGFVNLLLAESIVLRKYINDGGTETGTSIILSTCNGHVHILSTIECPEHETVALTIIETLLKTLGLTVDEDKLMDAVEEVARRSMKGIFNPGE